MKDCRSDFRVDLDVNCEEEEGQFLLSYNTCACENDNSGITLSENKVSDESQEHHEWQESYSSSSESELIQRNSSSCITSDEENLGVFEGNASSNRDDCNLRQECDNNLNKKVARIAIKDHLIQSAINAYLGLLCELGHVVSKDARTILGTTRQRCNKIMNIFGLISGLKRKI